MFIGTDGTAGTAPVTDVSQIYGALLEIVGITNLHPNGIQLQRQLPLADPLYPWLFAEEIGPVQGGGRFGKIAADPFSILEAPTFDFVALYPTYDVPTTFTPRPYVHAKDNQIGLGKLTYVDPQGVPSQHQYAKEWLRYTYVERLPAGEYIVCQAGQFQIDVAALRPIPGIGNAFPGGVAAGTGQIKLFIPKPGIKVTWFEVPDTYIDTAGPNNFEMGLGCVNQSAWGPGRYQYPAGTLLLHAVIVNRYTPLVPQVTSWDGNSLIFANNKLCDIEMLFVYLDPPLGKDEFGNPATPGPPAIPIQDVQGGHNLVPYSHRNSYYYAKTVGVSTFTDANNRPIFPSYPHQMLFAQPGA